MTGPHSACASAERGPVLVPAWPCCGRAAVAGEGYPGRVRPPRSPAGPGGTLARGAPAAAGRRSGGHPALRTQPGHLEGALVLDQKAGDTWGVAIIHNSLAAASLLAGRSEEAHRLLVSVLADITGSGDLELMAATLELAAGIAAHLGDTKRAARLAGAAEAIRDKTGIPITESDAAWLERYLAPAR